MHIQHIRTTISLPIPLHRQLKEEALEKGKSLNKLLIEKIKAEGPLIEPLKVKARKIGVRGSPRRKDIYEEILEHRGVYAVNPLREKPE